MIDSEYIAGNLPRKGGNSVDLFGCAIFNGDKMIGELNGHETRLLLITRGEFKQGFFTIEDPIMPELIIPIDIRQKESPDVKISFSKNRPAINVAIALEGDILAIQSGISYERPDMNNIVENALNQRIKSGIEELIIKCQDLNVDVFKFGGKVARKFATIQNWEKYNWLERFNEADITVDVEFKIRRTGTMLKSSPIKISTIPDITNLGANMHLN